MESQSLQPESDLYRLAVADLHGITPVKTNLNGRFWAYFDPSKVDGIFRSYEDGSLRVSARDFASALTRVKDKVFSAQRMAQAQGAFSGPSHH